jgi:hypothetical protein
MSGMPRARVQLGLRKGRFLKKAAQKLSRNWAGGSETSTAQFKKVFCFFFPKKKRFLLFL